MSLFRLDASIRTEGSHSREIADIVEREWQENHPSESVIRRDLGRSPIPAEAWANAVSAGWTPADARTPEQAAAAALAAAETDKLLAADQFLLAVPLYNYGVSQHLKAWVDLIIADPRMSSANTDRPLAGKPAVLVIVRGGGYAPGTPREGWDHATGWMRRVLADLWGLDLEIVEAELTLAGTVPAMESLIGLRDKLRADAEEAARKHGRGLAATTA